MNFEAMRALVFVPHLIHLAHGEVVNDFVHTGCFEASHGPRNRHGFRAMRVEFVV